MVAEVQKRGGIAGFIDAEHALDPVFMREISEDIDNPYISQPTTVSRRLRLRRRWSMFRAVDIIIVDSAAHSFQRRRLDGDMEIPTWITGIV